MTKRALKTKQNIPKIYLELKKVFVLSRPIHCRKCAADFTAWTQIKKVFNRLQSVQDVCFRIFIQDTKWLILTKWRKTFSLMGSECDSVVKTVASEIRSSQFKFCHRQIFLLPIAQKRRKLRKEVGNGPFRNIKTNICCGIGWFSGQHSFFYVMMMMVLVQIQLMSKNNVVLNKVKRGYCENVI